MGRLWARCLALLAFLVLIPRAETLDPCVDVDANKVLAEWSCKMDRRSSTSSGTVEHAFSIAAGAVFNIAVSTVSGAIDLTIFLVLHAWDLLVLAITGCWNIAVSWITELWGAYTDLAQACVAPIPLMWAWWYVAVWNALVVAALKVFIILVVPAFCIYVVWAAFGVPVCLAVTLALLLFVIVSFFFFVLLIAIVFLFWIIVIVLLFLIGVLLLFILTIIAIIICLLTLFLVLGLTLLGLSLVLGTFVFLNFLGWGVIISAASFIAVSVVGMLIVILRTIGNQRAVDHTREGSSTRVSHALGICKQLLVFMVVYIQKVFTFLFDLSLMNATILVFMDVSNVFPFPNVREGQASILLEPVLGASGLEDMFNQVESWFRFVPQIGIWMNTQLSLVCPGAAGVFSASQLAVGLFTVQRMQSKEYTQIKSVLAHIFLLAEHCGATLVCKPLSLFCKQSIYKLTEFLLAGGTTFILIFVPQRTAACDYEGDVIMTGASYVVVLSICVIALLIMPGMSISGRGLTYYYDGRHFNSDSINYCAGSTDTGESFFRDVCALFLLSGGYWTEYAFHGAQSSSKKSNVLSNEGGHAHYMEEAEGDDSLYQQLKNCYYLQVSADFSALSFEMLPLGPVCGRIFQWVHEGFVWVPSEIQATHLSRLGPTMWSGAEKVCAILRAIFGVAICFSPVSVKLILFLVAIIVIFLGHTFERRKLESMPRINLDDHDAYAELNNFSLYNSCSSICREIGEACKSTYCLWDGLLRIARVLWGGLLRIARVLWGGLLRIARVLRDGLHRICQYISSCKTRWSELRHASARRTDAGHAPDEVKGASDIETGARDIELHEDTEQGDGHAPDEVIDIDLLEDTEQGDGHAPDEVIDIDLLEDTEQGDGHAPDEVIII